MKAASEEQSSKGTALVAEDDAGWRIILAELLADVMKRGCNSFGEALGCLI
jgi:hypothetical protein